MFGGMWISVVPRSSSPMEERRMSRHQIELILKFLSRSTPKGLEEERELVSVISALRQQTVSQRR